MLKLVFNILTSPLSIFDNALYDYIALGIVGFLAYKIAFYLVGETDFRGMAGSILHWIIRLIIYFSLCLMISALLFIYRFIILHKLLSILTVFCIGLLLILCKMIKNNQNFQKV